MKPHESTAGPSGKKIKPTLEVTTIAVTETPPPKISSAALRTAEDHSARAFTSSGFDMQGTKLTGHLK